MKLWTWAETLHDDNDDEHTEKCENMLNNENETTDELRNDATEEHDANSEDDKTHGLENLLNMMTSMHIIAWQRMNTRNWWTWRT